MTKGTPALSAVGKSSRETTVSSSRADIYLDRELSQLAFNRRVLAQAEDTSIPLLERLRYLCIVSSNLDEFFEIRIASLLAQHHIDGAASHPLVYAAMLERMSTECHDIVERQYSILNNEILPRLSAKGIHLLRHSERNKAQRAWVKQYFDREVRPILTPIGLERHCRPVGQGCIRPRVRHCDPESAAGFVARHPASR
jgi:polyphosphate kinase